MSMAILSGLEGFQRAEAQVDQAARQIAHWPSSLAQAGAASSSEAPIDVVDLSSSVLLLIEGKIAGMANLKSIHVAGEMQKETLDLLSYYPEDSSR